MCEDVRSLRAEEIKHITGVSSIEQETTINISRNRDVAYVYTNDNTMITKLRKKVETSPNDYTCTVAGYSKETHLPSGYYFEFPKKLLSFRNWRTISDEQRARVRERLMKYHATK